MRTAERAGSAMSATATKAPAAAEVARANRQGPRVGVAGPPPSRLAMTAPKTVALAVIQVAQPRLPSQALSSGVSVAGQTTTPRP